MRCVRKKYFRTSLPSSRTCQNRLLPFRRASTRSKRPASRANIMSFARRPRMLVTLVGSPTDPSGLSHTPSKPEIPPTFRCVAERTPKSAALPFQRRALNQRMRALPLSRLGSLLQGRRAQTPPPQRQDLQPSRRAQVPPSPKRALPSKQRRLLLARAPRRRPRLRRVRAQLRTPSVLRPS